MARTFQFTTLNRPRKHAYCYKLFHLGSCRRHTFTKFQFMVMSTYNWEQRVKKIFNKSPLIWWSFNVRTLFDTLHKKICYVKAYNQWVVRKTNIFNIKKVFVTMISHQPINLLPLCLLFIHLSRIAPN